MGCCQWLVKPLLDFGVPKQNIDVYEIGKLYDYKALKISPIKLYHGDCPQCGYRLFIGDIKVFFATDTEHLQGISAKDYSYYFIESNYGEEEIQERIRTKQENGEYCYELNAMQRHLSHEQASEFLLENMGQHSNYVFLHGHKDKPEKPKDWEYQDE